MNLTVFGAGSWGCALAQCAQENTSVLVYCRSNKEAQQINDNTKDKYMPNVKFNFKATANLQEALDFGDVFLITIPVKNIREFLLSIKDYDFNPKYIISGSKGFEKNTLKLPTEIIQEFFPNANVGALTGPSHAESLLLKAPTAISAIGDEELRKIMQNIFFTSYFKLYSCDDLFGAQFYGAAKNVYAIGAGAVDAFAAQDNTKAFYITKALYELQLLGTKMGANPKTIFSLSGIGDFLVTCYSTNSRNWNYGKYLVTKKSKDKPSMEVEGLNTIKSLKKLQEKYQIRMPILEQVYHLVNGEKDPKQIYQELAVFRKGEQ